jgi:hypothetical protein
MDIISAYREVGSYRGTAELWGTTHKTVRRVIEAHQASSRGEPPAPRVERGRNYDSVAQLVGEKVNDTAGRISAKRLLPAARAAGYEGSDRNFRRLVADAKREWRIGQARAGGRRPSVWTPGEVLAIDWGTEIVAGRRVHVFCAVLVDERDRMLRVIEPITGEIHAEHALVAPGETSIDDAHYDRPRPATLQRRARGRTKAEKQFLALSPVAEQFLVGAAAAGVTKLNTEIATVLDLGAAHGTDALVAALERAVACGRWRADDVRSILATNGHAPRPTPAGQALVMTLPTVPTRPLEAYRLNADTATSAASADGGDVS